MSTQAIPQSLSGSRLRRWHLHSDRVFWSVCLVPPLVILLLIYLYPLAYSFQNSLTNASMLREAEFVGFDNYVNILSDRNVLRSIRITLFFSGVSLALELAIGFGLALLLQQIITQGRGILRTMIILPIMLTPVVMGLQWRMMLNYDFGIANYFVELLGFPKMRWLIDADQAMISVIAAEVWLNTGFVMMVLAAGLVALPQEVLEAADIDGAAWWRKIWDIMIPLLKPVLLIVLLFRSYGLLRTFDVIYSLTQGGPGRATEVLSTYIFGRMFQNWQIGYSTAVSYVLLAITLVVCLVLIFWMDVDDAASRESGR